MTKSLPGICGKPRKFTHVVEAVMASLETFVAAGGDDERVARGDRLRHRLPQFEGDGGIFAMAFSPRRSRPALAPLVNVSLPALNQPSSKESSPLAVKLDVRIEGAHRAASAKRRIGEIDAATPVAEVGRTGRRVEPAAVL